MSTFAEDLEHERFRRLAHLLVDVRAALEFLSPAERAEYERSQQSIVDAAIWLRPPGR